MKYTKRIVLGITIALIGLGLYNLCVFLIVKEYSNVFWTSYIFTTLAFVVEAATIALISKANFKDDFLKLPFFNIGSIYFIIQFIAGIICIAVPFAFKIAVIVQTAIFAMYITGMLVTILAQNHIDESDDRIQKSTAFIRNLARSAECLYLTADNETSRTELKKLYEAIRYADPVSSIDEIQELDKKINVAFRSVSDTAKSATADDLKEKVKYALDLITTRNLINKSNK